MMQTARLLLAVLAAAVLAPAGANAQTTTYTAPYTAGPAGGDQFNYRSVDAATGRVSVFRLQPPLVSGGLGCGGRAGWATLRLADITAPIASVSVTVADAAWNPFTWVTLSVRSTDDAGAGVFLGTTKARGPGAGSATVTLAIDPLDRAPAGRAQEVRFGLEVSSSCVPNLDGGTVRFSSVTVETA